MLTLKFNIKPLVPLFLIFNLFVCTACSAEKPKWQVLFQAGEKAAVQGNYTEGEKLLKDSIKESKTWVEKAASLISIGINYSLQEKYSKAISFYEQADNLYKTQKLSSTDPQLLFAADNNIRLNFLLCEAYVHTGDCAKAKNNLGIAESYLNDKDFREKYSKSMQKATSLFSSSCEY